MDDDAGRYHVVEKMFAHNDMTYARNVTDMSIYGEIVCSGFCKYQEALDWLEVILIPVLVAVGVVGNTLSFVVFVATHLKRTSCHTYLASLAVVDNIFLAVILGKWLSKLNIVRKGYTWCKLSTYLMYVSGFLSMWYVVGFTIERYIAVCYPLKREAICNAKVARNVVITLAVVGLVTHLFTFHVMGYISQFDICAFFRQFESFMQTIIPLETMTSLLTPTIVIIACNIRIVCVVRGLHRRHKACDSRLPAGVQSNYNRRLSVQEISMRLASESHNPTDCYRKWQFNVVGRRSSGYQATCAIDPKVDQARNRKRASVRSTHMRATRMLLLVSTAFLLCNMPRHTLRSYMTLRRFIHPEATPSPGLVLLMRAFTLLYYVHFAVNVFLYSVSGRSFRVGMQRLRVKCSNKIHKHLLTSRNSCW